MKKYIRTVERRRPDPEKPGKYVTLPVGEIVDGAEHPGPGFMEYNEVEKKPSKAEPTGKKVKKEGTDNG